MVLLLCIVNKMTIKIPSLMFNNFKTQNASWLLLEKKKFTFVYFKQQCIEYARQWTILTILMNRMYLYKAVLYTFKRNNTNTFIVFVSCFNFWNLLHWIGKSNNKTTRNEKESKKSHTLGLFQAIQAHWKYMKQAYGFKIDRWTEKSILVSRDSHTM